MRVLVTGGAGFIGSHITDRMLTLRHTVDVLDDLSTGKRSLVNRRSRLIVRDVRSPAVERLVRQRRYDAIIHCAAQKSVRVSMDDPVTDADINVLGTMRLAHAAVGRTRRFILLSTGGAMYGSRAKTPTPESAGEAPESPYGTSKLMAETFLEYLSRTGTLSTIALRLANVYGPRQDAHGEAGVVAIFATRLLSGQSVTIFGDGRQTRDFVVVDDVVAAVERALKGKQSGAFNIGTSAETSVNALYRQMARLAHVTTRAHHEPPRAGEQRRSALNCALASRTLAWKPRVTLADGLARTLAWFRENQ